MTLHGLPVPRIELREEREPSALQQAAERIEAMIGRHIETVNEMLDSPPPADALTWRRAHGRRVIRPFERATEL